MKHYLKIDDVFLLTDAFTVETLMAIPEFDKDGNRNRRAVYEETHPEVVAWLALQVPTQEQIDAARVAELKQNLANTDFKVLPDYDKPNDDIKIQRQKWRDEIRSLEA